MAETPVKDPEVSLLLAASAGDQKKKVLILYTGGTMGMRVDTKDGSLKPEKGYLTERILEMAEFSRPEMPTCVIKEYDELLDRCVAQLEHASLTCLTHTVDGHVPPIGSC
jgi:Asparaginase, N-terminal